MNIEIVELDPAHPAVTRLPYAEAIVRSSVAVAVGTGSVCWESMEGTGTFDDQLALTAVEEAVAKIIAAVGLGDPNLGCATTKELRAELAARESLGNTAEDYRTVD